MALMGLGKLLHNRSTEYVATNTETGETQTFTIIDNLAPDWATSGYRGGMGIPGAWRSSLLLSDLIGSVPWHAYREYGGRDVERLKPTPPLLEQPNPPETRMNSFSSAALDLIWEGNAVFIISARNRENWPTAAYPAPAAQVGVRRVGRGEQRRAGTIEYRYGTQTFGAEDVIHIKGPCEPGALRGMGVLEAHWNTIDLATELSRQARSIAVNGVPTGLLKASNPDTSDDELRAGKEAWLLAQRTRTIAALRAGTDFEPLSWNPEELQLVESRKFSLHEVALIFGVPLSFLGVETSNRTYRNDESEGINLIKFSLGGHFARFEQALTLAFPRGTEVKANMDAILRSDTLTRYQAHAIALDKGFLTEDEVRDLENRAPLPKPDLEVEEDDDE